MSIDTVRIAGASSVWGALTTLTDSDGTASQLFAHRLATTVCPLRDLADAVHLICMLHGHRPGVIDHAVGHVVGTPASEWMVAAAEAFALERGYIVQLVAAAGPLPSTPGQAESESAVSAQRHAVEILAQSDRRGTAAGAAIALALDWRSIRGVLDTAAQRLGIAPPACELPPLHDTATMVDALADGTSIERAMMFGAQQLLAQHRGLWSLLDARASARGHL
jgi:hypothetical protein